MHIQIGATQDRRTELPCELFFTDATRLDLPIVIDGQPLLVGGKPYRLPDAAKRAFEAAAIPNGMPFMLNADGSYAGAVNAFLRSLPANGCPSRNTWRGYAYDIKAFAGYLAAQPDSPGLFRVERHHVDGFACARRLSAADAERAPIHPSTWNRGIAALDKLYTWAADRDATVKAPFTYKETVVRMAGGGVIATRRNNALAREGDKGVVRCISLGEYLQFRDIGLLGRLPDGSADASFRGRNALRNGAFAELSITNGARLEENASILLAELPDPDAAQWKDFSSCPMQLGRLTTKGDKGRRIWVPKRVLRQHVVPYREEDRDNAVAKAMQAGTYAHLRNVIRVGAWHSRDCTAVGRSARLHYDMLAHADRARMFSVGADGEIFEPGMLWLTEQGLPSGMANFEAIFARACGRLAAFGIDIDVTPHVLRHTFATYMLAHLIRTCMESLDNLRFERRHASAGAYAALLHDPLRRLQKLLGHASSASTEIYLHYLEEADELVEEAIGSWGDRLGAPVELEPARQSDGA
jgi:hypothetical protein